MNKEQYLVFDIETAPVDYESLSESQQEYIVRYAKTEEEAEQKKFEMALSPMTATVVCIGLQLMQQSDEGLWEIASKAAFSQDASMKPGETRETVLSNYDKCIYSDEKTLLETFWNILKKYDRAVLVSFNGRNFDAPFLMLRSALHRVRPVRNLMAGTKFNYPMHVDLADELTFYNPGPYSASRRFNFDFYTRAFGITSPKSAGVDGSMVGELFREGKTDMISEYCLRDISATWELFLVWKDYLKF